MCIVRRVRVATMAVTAVGSVFAVSVAANATPAARLVYSRAAGAESCADEDALRAAVAKRVGHDPFVPSAKQTVVASMAPASGAGFVARVRLIDEDGTEYGTREFHAGGACADLLDTAALAIAIAIDPQSLAPRPAGPPPPAAEVAPPVPAPDAPRERRAEREEPPADATRVPEGSPVAFDGLAGVVASAGFAPALAIGAELGGGLRWRDASLGLEGRIDAPASTPAQGGGQASTWLVVATLAACGHAAPLFACAVAQAGAMRATGEAPGATDEWVPWWAAGGRFGVTAPLSDETDIRVRSDLVVDLAPPRLHLNGIAAPVWDAPRVAESLGADVVVHFR